MFSGTHTLLATGERSGMTVNIEAWFHPELNANIVIAPSVERAAVSRELPPEFLERATNWREGIPRHLITDDQAYSIQAHDENNVPHFLSEYLARIVPPKEMQDPRSIHRMIQCFTFSSDKETLNKEDIWSSPVCVVVCVLSAADRALDSSTRLLSS